MTIKTCYTLPEIEAALDRAAHRPAAGGVSIPAWRWRDLMLEELAGPERPEPVILVILSFEDGSRLRVTVEAPTGGDDLASVAYYRHLLAGLEAIELGEL